MYPREQLRRTLARIDGRPFPAYRDLSGAYDFGDFRLHVDHVQADPYAAPSRLRVLIPAAGSGLVPDDWRDTARRVAVEDWLLRRLASALGRATDGAAGAGPPGAEGVADGPPAGHLHVLMPGQQVLDRSAVAVRAGAVELRLTCDLPADRRSVLGRRAAAVIDIALPAAVLAMPPRGAADRASLAAHIALVEDQEALRAELASRGWVAFLADGSILPRRSGSSDLPLGHREAVRLLAPESLAATVRLPHRGEVRGLPVPSGVTLVVGGAYHGKSTLLRAIERGIYNHVAGDGRELCVSDPRAVSVAADDGRPVAGVDIAAFVRTLPGGRDTKRFRTTAASGSTSQAAALCEALEMGARCLLLDEDRSAANFMSRDARMRALVPDDEDPVVPFVERIHWLYRGRGVSTVLALGGAGTFLDVADRVIRMRNYQPLDVTADAAAVAARLPVAPAGAPAPAPAAPPRALAPEPFLAVAGPGGRVRARPRGRDGIAVGDAHVDLSHLTQVADEAQLRALADMLPRAAAYADGSRTLPEVVAEVERDIDRLGLEVLSPWPGQCPGDYARPRGMELAAAINRVPGLRLQGDPEGAQEGLPHRRRLVRRVEPGAPVRGREDRDPAAPKTGGPSRRAPSTAARDGATGGLGTRRPTLGETHGRSRVVPGRASYGAARRPGGAGRPGRPDDARGPRREGGSAARTPGGRQGRPDAGRGGSRTGRVGLDRDSDRLAPRAAASEARRGPGRTAPKSPAVGAGRGPQPSAPKAPAARPAQGPDRSAQGAPAAGRAPVQPRATVTPGRAPRFRPVLGTLAGFSGADRGAAGRSDPRGGAGTARRTGRDRPGRTGQPGGAPPPGEGDGSTRP